MKLRKPLLTLGSLVALMCVVSVLYGLVYAIGKPHRDAVKCRRIARSIGFAIRNYASNWQGWYNPDPEYYVRDFGYRLSSETGYFDEAPPWYDPDATVPTRSQDHAANIDAFRCPVDGSPEINRHGIPSSYRVMYPLMVGVAYPWTAAEIPFVLESGTRHSDREKAPTRGGHCVFADMHVEVRDDVPRLIRLSRGEE